VPRWARFLLARDPQLIKTVRNEGYVLTAEVKKESAP